MKNYYLALALVFAVISCEQNSVKQTTDTIKSADSLIRSANDGFKTLDSISAIVNDSARINKVIIPQIEKTKKQAQDAIAKNAGSLDSIAGTIDKVKREINRGSDIIKTVDSANKKLKEDGTIFDKITTITDAVSKVTKQTKKPATPAPKPPVQPQNNGAVAQQPSVTNSQNESPSETYVQDPMVKTAKLSIGVDEIGTKRDQLAQDLRNYGGEIVTESFGQEAGHNKVYLTAKVPYKYFDQTVNRISQNYGQVNLKNIEAEGSDYDPNQMCDIELTFTENAAQADGMFTDNSKPAQDKPKTEAGDAFNKGLKNFGNVMVWLLPFWPFLLIGGLIWYFAARRKRKKQKLDLQKMQQEIARMKTENAAKANATQSVQTEAPPSDHVPNNNGSDYSKYMPK